MTGYTFVEGQGTFYGVPARDLTQAEFDALAPDQQRIVRESPAYTEGLAASGLSSLSRADLEARADEVGVVGADQYANKAQLVAAIEAVLAGSVVVEVDKAIVVEEPAADGDAASEEG